MSGTPNRGGCAGVIAPRTGAAPRIRVLIADDQGIVRGGIAALLAAEPDLDVVAQAADGQAALRLVERHRPDVVLIDVVLPGLPGVEAIRRIAAHDPDVRVVVLTSGASEENVLPALRAGAIGYILKAAAPEELARAVRQAYRGQPPLHPEVARKLLLELRAVARAARTPPSVDRLTAREIEVLRLIACGLSNEAIADRLVVTESTVRTHSRRILAKLRLASRTQAALYALRAGYSSLDEAQLPSGP